MYMYIKTTEFFYLLKKQTFLDAKWKRHFSKIFHSLVTFQCSTGALETHSKKERSQIISFHLHVYSAYSRIVYGICLLCKIKIIVTFMQGAAATYFFFAFGEVDWNTLEADIKFSIYWPRT